MKQREKEGEFVEEKIKNSIIERKSHKKLENT